MKPFIVYCSKTGNTKKIAETMADETGTEAHNISDVRNVPKGTFLLTGSGVYGGNAGKGILNFIESLPKVKSGKAAVFETSGDGKKIVAGEQMKWALEKKGYKVTGSFVCSGTMFKIFRRGYPKPEHFEQAKKFAKSLK
ncbi:MAG: flavodoxin [Candidatus Aenigmarchaeota archaeon]|nr:flavodoxin [Candidatus Aenigmarchaeota archaeon]